MRNEKVPVQQRIYICRRCGKTGGTMVKAQDAGYVHLDIRLCIHNKVGEKKNG